MVVVTNDTLVNLYSQALQALGCQVPQVFELVSQDDPDIEEIKRIVRASLENVNEEQLLQARSQLVDCLDGVESQPVHSAADHCSRDACDCQQYIAVSSRGVCVGSYENLDSACTDVVKLKSKFGNLSVINRFNPSVKIYSV